MQKINQDTSSNAFAEDCSLTFEAVDIVSSVNLGEARLVAVAIDSSDPRFAASTALSGGDDGVAHAPVCQPARTAEVQSVVPGCVQLSRGDQLGPVTQTVGLGLREGEALGGGAMKHLTFTQGDRCQVLMISCLLVCCGYCAVQVSNPNQDSSMGLIL